MTPLPPTVTKTRSGATANPLRAVASAAIAARSSGIPGKGA